MTAFYDPLRTYEDNYAFGPFGCFAEQAPPAPTTAPSEHFLGHAVNRPFGIPAGPLVNATFCEAAFRWGYDINAYKTVRSAAHPCHPFPNTLAVHLPGPLTRERAGSPVLADADFADVQSITNSFGVPSQDPDVWQVDMAAAVRAAGVGQVLIGSFQGTRPEEGVRDREGAFIADHVRTAALVVETGASILEMNLSCPNEGAASLLCFDTPTVVKIVTAVKERIGDVPLLLKLAYFPDDASLARLVGATRGLVQGYAAVNTIPATLVDAGGAQALPGEGREVGGVCGAAIAWAGLEMTARLHRLRNDAGADYAVVGVGGVRSVDDYRALREAGADAVMSATGAMFEPGLGRRIQSS